MRYQIRRSNGDATLDEAKRLFIESVNQARQTSRGDIIGIHSQTKDTVTLLQKGIEIVDSDGIPTGDLVPWFQSAWENYRPNHHIHLGKLSTARFLTQDWRPFRNRRGRQDDAAQRNL